MTAMTAMRACIHPRRMCDELDNKCDGQVDEGVGTTYYVDRDGDGFGDDDSIEVHSIRGVAEVGGDCDDTNDTVNPDADELCDNIDNNCNSSMDEDMTNTYYLMRMAMVLVTMRPCWKRVIDEDYVENSADCDDLDPNVHPLATESCDDIDNNCDGQIDETGAVGSPVVPRLGQRRYGNPSNFMISCDQPMGYVSNSTDCNDTDGNISPSMSGVRWH